MKTFQQFQEDTGDVRKFIELKRAAEKTPEEITAKRESKHKERVAAARERHEKTLQTLRAKETQFEQISSMSYGLTPTQRGNRWERMDNKRAAAARQQRSNVSRSLRSKKDPHPGAMRYLLTHE